ncbi:MAG: hypothetical protein NTW32_08980 [Chloroflexi bacterium]|nr:hypothetical protein [Chloroflexota bacterium]
MTPRSGIWVYDPGSGGTKISPKVQADVTKRINQVAEENYKGRYIRLDIRFKSQFCYIDAFVEPHLAEGWPPPDWDETREQALERIRSTPLHLCRLRYFGTDDWGFAFYTYSQEKYELSVYPNGEFSGKPEDAFLAAAMYLEN